MNKRIFRMSSRRLCLVACCMACLPLFGATWIGLSASHAQGAEAEDTLWSFSFKNLPVAQVLEQLSQETGIDIFTNQPPKEKRVTKTYENETIEEIIRDVFRGDNYTLVWDYNGGAIQSIGINFFEQGATSPDRSPGVSRFNRGAQSVERNFDDERDARRRLARPVRRTPPPVRAGNRVGGTTPKDATEEEQADDNEASDEQNQDEENPDESGEEVTGLQGKKNPPSPPQDEQEEQEDES